MLEEGVCETYSRCGGLREVKMMLAMYANKMKQILPIKQ